MAHTSRLLGVIGTPMVVALLSLAFPVRAAAQSADLSAPDAASAPAPAHIAFVEGSAVLERDGETDTTPANMPLLAGDRVRTRTGRVEILFADGSTLHMDNGTTVDFQSDELVRLLDGRIRLAIPGPNHDVSYRIDAPSASVEISQPGEYRVAVLHGAREAEIELAVLRGGADLVNDDGRTALRAGERAYSRPNIAPSNAYAFNSASWDAFDRWSEARRDDRLRASAEYLPDQVRPYAASFDRYGSWQYDASYGNVWYPSVSVGWRPYYYGRWVTLRPYGWTWVGSDPWAWPTHHYGRWGFSAGAWFWIPGRSWAPAWVSWAYAPGYVSWCPLGWNNRPIFQINVGVYSHGYDPWRAWTAVPQRHFGVGFVNTRYVGGHTFDARTRAAFVPRGGAPDLRGYAVPSAAAPIRVAGTGGGRRVSSPVYTNLGPGDARVGAAPSRLLVGPPRGAADRGSRAAAPGLAAERSRAIPRDRNTSGPSRASVPGTTDAYAAPDRRAVSRESTVRGGGPSSSRRYDPAGNGNDPVAAHPAPRGADNPVYRADPHGQRAPEETADPRPVRGGVQDRQPYGARAAPREAPDSPRSSPPRPYRQEPMSPPPERRAPAAERAPERQAERAPERSRSGGSGSGQPSSGTATRRPGGRR